MNSNQNVSESGRKRARTAEASCSSSSIAVRNKNDAPKASVCSFTFLRAIELKSKLKSLSKEFPEIKYIVDVDFENLQTHVVEAAVEKYMDDGEDEMNGMAALNHLVRQASGSQNEESLSSQSDDSDDSSLDSNEYFDEDDDSMQEEEDKESVPETEAKKQEEDEEEKKRKAQLSLNYGKKEIVPFHSLPDEVLSNCLSYVGRGHYGLVGLASKKLYTAYKAEFGRETACLEMASTVSLANHCLRKLCKYSKDKVELLKAAAVNGNLDILRAAVEDGYELCPLVAMKKGRTVCGKNVFYFGDDYFEMHYNWKPANVKLSKLVERGHLHVLKYLYEELFYDELHRYSLPAIQHGQVEMLQWLDDIGCMKPNSFGFMDDYELKSLDFCKFAILNGSVEALKWLHGIKGYVIKNHNNNVLADAISSKSTEMIQYCFDLGYNNLGIYGVEVAIKETQSVAVFRLMYELGYDFGRFKIKKWHSILRGSNYTADYFEIIRFLRSISIPWDDGFMKDIVQYGTLEMIQYAYEDGCPWTTSGEEYTCLFKWKSRSERCTLEKFNYLIKNGCSFDYEEDHVYGLMFGLEEWKDFFLLENFVGKNSSFDNMLFRRFLDQSEVWFEGIDYLLEKGKDIQIFKSIEEVFHVRHRRHDIDVIKYFHSLGWPWCLDSSRNTQLLSEIACYNGIFDVLWAYDNGCHGGHSVQYVKEEWDKNSCDAGGGFIEYVREKWEKKGIRKREEWKENQYWFEENEMLDDTFLVRKHRGHA
ncbi:hypothetical protein CTEN210_01208 [Chaetoceros tenuissimus]|uniref:Uncharacterized protein n=1 Tax=Chaetoceros tenuissimus TaxID=426638 RepID=A0AAD3GZV5_9STRA|nr:hypothetical protein CTEN210_01208 [Chaetoceros tenuissimus]